MVDGLGSSTHFIYNKEEFQEQILLLISFFISLSTMFAREHSLNINVIGNILNLKCRPISVLDKIYIILHKVLL